MLQLGFHFFGGKSAREIAPAASPLLLHWKQGLTVHLVRHPRARRYLLRLQPDGTARLVVPRRGNRAEALRFLERSEAWLLESRRKWQARASVQSSPWRDGARFLFRGEETILRVEEKEASARLSFAGHAIETTPQNDYRKIVLTHLRRLAEKELPPRTRELARDHAISIARVTVRAQKTRWGSCSARGTISLNWRLIHAPDFVRDYLILHELMHRREMNHSIRYWKHVAAACPAYREAEAWLKRTRLDQF